MLTVLRHAVGRMIPATQGTLSDEESTPRPDRTRICIIRGPQRLYSRRIAFGSESVSVLGWPSRGGLIFLERALGLHFEFLGLDPLNLAENRDPDQDAEDAFCQQLLLLGAKWFDSFERYQFVAGLSTGDPTDFDDLENERKVPPTFRERRWVCVGWPSEPKGSLYVVDYETNMPIIEDDEENMKPDEAPRVMLARSMDECCEILKRMGAKFYSRLEDYDGLTFLRAWEWKIVGEAGPLVKVPYPTA